MAKKTSMKRKNVNDMDEEEEQQQQQGQPPRKITKNHRGQIRKYIFLKTVKSMEELDNLRFKNYCRYSLYKPLQILKSLSIPCSRKISRKGCDFELMALRSADLASGHIHVYTFSEHNHPLIPEERRLLHSNKKMDELIPDADPPQIYVTADGIEWTFIETFPDYGKVDEFRRKNRCRTSGAKFWRIRLMCRLKSSHNCKFMMMRMKTTKNGYHVYQHGEHNHEAPGPKRWSSQRLQSTAKCHPKMNKQIQMEDDKDEEEDREKDDEDREEDEDYEEDEKESDEEGVDEDEKEEDEEEDDVEEEEEEEQEDSDDDDDDDDDDEQPHEDQQKPPRHISIYKKNMGQKRKYYFLKTVKSMEELDKFRFENYCSYMNGKPVRITSKIIPCSRKKSGRGCDFELRAIRSDLKSADIHVYAFSKHNHPLISEEIRSIVNREKELMPDQNPPPIYRTEDNIQWSFIQTFPNYEQMHSQFKSQCLFSRAKGKWRMRLACYRGCSHNCKFKLLAVKTITEGYHVYKHGEHQNHPTPQRTNRQVSSADEEEEEEEEEDNVDGKDEEEEKEKSGEEGEEEEKEDSGKEGEVVEEEHLEDAQIEEVEEPEEVEEVAIEQVEDGDIILMEDDEQHEERREDSIEIAIIEENPLANPREETLELEERLAKACKKVYDWMAGIGPNEIEQTIEGWDKSSLLKIVEMADLEIREHPEKLNVWLPWLKCAIPKCLPQIEGFNVRFKELIKLTFN